MASLRLAVIGVGHLGKIHTRLWKEVSGAELRGVFDTDTATAEAVAAEHSIAAYPTIDAALHDCDAVTIAAPTLHHHALALRALQAGKHCFIEKPITSTYAEALELIATAGSQNLVIQVGHVERFNPALTALRAYALHPMFIEAHRLAQFKPRATDVSVIHDLMIHDIDIALWLAQSEVERIDASGVAVLTDTPDIANARIRFKNGCVANLTASRMAQHQMRKMRLFQPNAYIALDFANSGVEVFRLEDSDTGAHANGSPALMLGQIDAGTRKKSIFLEKPAVTESNAILEEQQAFLAAIVDRSPIAVSARDGAEALRIAESISAQIAGQPQGDIETFAP